MDNNVSQVLHLAETVGCFMLENGAETYRAEETVLYICRAAGYPDAQALVIPTGVFIMLKCPDGQRHTSILRVSRRGINLNNIHEANAIARRMAQGLSVEGAIAAMEQVQARPPLAPWVAIAAAGLCSGFFALLFGGALLEFCIATFCGVLVRILGQWTQKLDSYQVINSLFGGIIIGLVSTLSVTILGQGNLDAIIAGAVLPLLPGLAMTVAIRDTMRGDLVSGVARGAEALLVAACVAVGVGGVLGVWFRMGGHM